MKLSFIATLLVALCAFTTSHHGVSADKRNTKKKKAKKAKKVRKNKRRKNPKNRNGGGGGGGSNQPFPLTAFRSIEGTDRADALGESHTPLRRVTTVSYADGKGEMPTGLPNPRLVSNICLAQGSASMPNARALSDMVALWGQFLDHDIDLTDGGVGQADIPIPAFANDPFNQNGCTSIGFTRSDYVEDGEETRQQLNLVTSFVDGSGVYGSDLVRAAALRTFVGGKLKTSESGLLLPLNTIGLDNAGGTGSTLFLAGDIRANEQAGLTAMHTLFMREHNRLADLIAMHYPKKEDHEIFELARKLVGAEIQIVTFNEYMPAVLGETFAPSTDNYAGYDETIDPRIETEFSTVAYRYGHSMLSSSLKLADQDGAFGTVQLKDIFFNPTFFAGSPSSVDHLLGGSILQQAQEIDSKIIDDIRLFLFGETSCLDLGALNIQRGRDHGIPGYNDVREAYGLPRHTGFAGITSDEAIQAHLAEAYDSVDQVDAWVGGLSEDHGPGGSMGETFATIIADQFHRLMHGDPFFYLNDPDLATFFENEDSDEEEARRLQSTSDEDEDSDEDDEENTNLGILNLSTFSLAEVIRQNTILKNLDPETNVFFV